MLAVVLIAAIFTIAPISAGAVTGEPEIAGTSITLNGAIGLNFYVKENGNTDYTPYFDFNGDLIYSDSEPKSHIFDDPVYDTTNTYRIYTIDLFAKQMTEEVTFAVSDTEKQTTSVREYAEKIISGECDATLTEQGYSADKIAKAKELCTAMLNYGAQAQLEFNYNTDDLANKNYSDYTAPEIDPASINDMDYTNPDGAWIVESSRAYQFVNTYDWEHVYVHYLFDEEIEKWYDDQNWNIETVFCDDITEEIFPSEYTYTDSYSDTDISNGKTVYIFDPTQDFRYLVFTDTPDSLNGINVYSDNPYAYYVNTQYDTSAGWKSWVNGEENSYETIYYSPVHFIDFVNVQKWDDISVDVITSEWSDQQDGYVEVSHVYPMTKLSEKAADGSDVYRFILPEEFTNNGSDITVKFTNGTETTLKTKYHTDNNIHRYTPSKRTDSFEKFGMSYSGSSIGLLQKIGYSLFFLNLDQDSYNYVELYHGDPSDFDTQLYSELDPQYQTLGYSCYPIRDIAPSDLLKPITITFRWYDDQSVAHTEDVEFTVYNYIKRALMLDDSSNNNVQLKKTVTALVDYAEKADAYFNAN